MQQFPRFLPAPLVGLFASRNEDYWVPTNVLGELSLFFPSFPRHLRSISSQSEKPMEDEEKKRRRRKGGRERERDGDTG